MGTDNCRSAACEDTSSLIRHRVKFSEEVSEHDEEFESILEKLSGFLEKCPYMEC